MIEEKRKRSVIVFLVITILLSSISEALWIIKGEEALNMGINSILMWTPAVVALIVRGIYYKKEAILGMRFCKLRYILTAIIVPVIYIGISYGIYWIINPDRFTGSLKPLAQIAEMYMNGASEKPSAVVITMLILVFSGLITATGEEIGWRGFLFPQMEKMWNFKKAVLVSGLIWAVWHMPILIAGSLFSVTCPEQMMIAN